jgi:iron complex outermembrane receptor protein
MMGETKIFICGREKPATALTAIALFIAGPTALALDSSPAKAHIAAQVYEIPGGSVADALNALADKSGAQLLYDAALTRHLTTVGVSGKHTLDGALRELLSGTGLTYKIDPGSSSVSIVLAQADTGRRNDASGAQALPPIEIGAERHLSEPSGNRGVKQPAGVSTSLDHFESERATTNDTAGLLRDVPGAFVYNAGGVSSLPVLDGLADDRLHVSVAGMPLLAACANHMNPPLSYIDPTHVGNIQVYSGIVPVSVGGDSIGGAILVNPSAPVFALPGKQVLTKGEVGTFYRSNGNAYGGNLSATAATENFSISYNGSFSRSENYRAEANFHLAGPAFAWTNNTLPFTRLGS